MPSIRTIVAAAVFAFAAACAHAQAEPMIHGTVFLSPDVITENDPSAFESLTPAGTEVRRMFDRRVYDWVEVEAHLFDVVYGDALCSRFQVNAELGDADEVRGLVEQYAVAIGRLPGFLRRDVLEVWMHPGDEVFGGGNDSILIHLGATSEKYIADGVLEEVLAHEAAHTSLHAALSESPEWIEAQEADGAFISEYARDNPRHEDVPETVVPWIAICCGERRVDEATEAEIRRLTANRLALLERSIGEWSELPSHGGKAGCEYQGEATD